MEPPTPTTSGYSSSDEPGTYKAELIRHLGPWKTRHQAEFATIEWIDWYNTTRLHGEIGHISPLERDAHRHASNTPAIMATSQPT